MYRLGCYISLGYEIVTTSIIELDSGSTSPNYPTFPLSVPNRSTSSTEFPSNIE